MELLQNKLFKIAWRLKMMNSWAKCKSVKIVFGRIVYELSSNFIKNPEIVGAKMLELFQNKCFRNFVAVENDEQLGEMQVSKKYVWQNSL